MWSKSESDRSRVRDCWCQKIQIACSRDRRKGAEGRMAGRQGSRGLGESEGPSSPKESAKMAKLLATCPPSNEEFI